MIGLFCLGINIRVTIVTVYGSFVTNFNSSFDRLLYRALLSRNQHDQGYYCHCVGLFCHELVQLFPQTTLS